MKDVIDAMTEEVQAKFEDLTPGSVWINKTGKYSRFMFLVNDFLPKEYRSAYPVQAVYADEAGNTYSVQVEDFLEKREFYNVDPTLEKRIGALMSDDEEDDSFTLNDSEKVADDDEDDDTLSIMTGGGDDEESDTETQDNDSESDDSEGEIEAVESESVAYVDYTRRNNNDVESVVISIGDLRANTLSYHQEPVIGENRIKHVLLINAVDGITKESIDACFRPENFRDNVLYEFNVVGPDNEIMPIEWDEYAGTFLAVGGNRLMYNVIFFSVLEIERNTVEVANSKEIAINPDPVSIVQSPVVVQDVVVALTGSAPDVATISPQVVVQATAA